MTWSVYLGSVYNNPEGIEIIGQFVNGDVTLFKGFGFMGSLKPSSALDIKVLFEEYI